MVACLRCGTENREGARFCDACAAPLLAAVAVREQRKVVTVLFCDVTGSTELGEQLDPEALRALLLQYFERMKTIVERHGGTVEKFIGDAVMAVFGVPVLHEDDALRALRAAVEMRAAFPELGVRGRIGVTTGEVVAGTEERLATGDAVNVAARLEQVAQPGEILIGEETLRLTRATVEVDAVEPRALKGKAKPVAAYRLLSVRDDGGSARRMDAPMVGREREQRQLASVWERVVSERACQLFTILGPAGVGKSRLAAEFLASLVDASVVQGHCLSYGDGITYWPVVEVIKQLPVAELDPVVAETTRVLMGDQQRVTSSEEIAWAFRKQLEVAASARPLVCVFDDLHWGEATFLDLVEHVADLARDAPILLLCMARPELLDRRTGWGGGKVNATTVLLEPLAREETELLIAGLADLDEDLCSRILEASEGNPFFVEEIVALLQESGAGEVAIPPTIQVLLAARLDQLDPAERDALQRGAVEGRIFHRGAVQALSHEGADAAAQLTALMRKELIRPDQAQLPGQDAFRFRHLLIREAAYDALPKAIRADLHERFAGWLAEHGPDLVELDELLGYHLEQSHRFRQELGQSGELLAARAAARLGAAGRRALDRGDMDGASNLLERAAALLEEDSKERLELEVELGEALLEGGRLSEAAALLEEALGRAMQTGDGLLQARAQVGLASVYAQTRGSRAHEEIARDVAPLVRVFEEAGDHRGAADALRLLGLLKRWSSDYTAAAELQERALLHARQVGDERREAAIIRHIGSTALWGPERVDLALARCRAILDGASNGRVKANCLVRIGGLEGLAGRFDAAWDAIDEARAFMSDLGLRHLKAHSSDVAVLVAMLAGDFERAEREARAAYVVLEEMGDRTFQPTEASLIGETLAAQGRLDEAEQWLAIRRGIGDADDEEPANIGLEALIMARRGHLDKAEELVRRCLALDGDTPVPLVLDPRFTLAEILLQAGRVAEAETEAEACLARYEAKGIVPLAQNARVLLAEIHTAGL
jgi:class 3 adenylate cyclase/tetratricopeptide (TPR) repeat protein